jgi:NAD(P)H-dependent FMN reductase
MNITIVYSSIREGASTRRVSHHLMNHLAGLPSLQPLLVDLTEYEYPLWKEVFHREESPPPACVELHDKLAASDSMIFVTPEYNGSYSLALKNMVDYFGLKVFERKVIGISSVSTGSMGGIRAAIQLQQLILAIYAIPVPQMLLVPTVQHRFDSEGTLVDPAFEKNISRFITDFLWYAEAIHEKRKAAVTQVVK